jgi:hypothetical protein
VIVWDSVQDSAGNDLDVCGQRYDANGNSQGGEFRVNTTLADKQKNPAIASVTNGGFVVVWESNNQDGDSYGIFGQQYDSNAKQSGSEFQVNTSTHGRQAWSAVAGLSAGGFIVAWISDTPYSVVGRQYSASGSPLGSEHTLSSTVTGYDQTSQTTPALAALSEGGFVAVWDTQSTDGSRDVFCCRFSSISSPVGNETQENIFTAGDQTKPVITRLAGDALAIAWQSVGQDHGASKGIVGRIE